MRKRRRRNPPRAVVIGVGALAGAAVLGWYLYKKATTPKLGTPGNPEPIHRYTGPVAPGAQ